MSEEVKRIDVGVVTAFAEAKRAATPYPYNREKFRQDLANLGATAAEVEANRQEVADNSQAVADDKADVEADKASVEQSAAAAAQSAENAHTDALAATAAKEAAQTAQGNAVEAKEAAVSAKTSAENAKTAAAQSAEAAAGSAHAAGEAAQTATAQASAASESAAAAAQSAEAAAEAARTLTIDTTLTQAGQAADAKKVGDAVTDLKSAIGQNTGAIEEGDWLYNKRIRTDSDPVNFTPASTTTGYYCKVLDCVAGEKFTLTGTAGNTNYRLYCFCQNDGTRVTGGLAPSGSSLKDAVITAPTGATKLVLNISTGKHYIFRGVTDTAKHAESVAADADLQSQINSFIKTSEYDFSEEPLRKWALKSGGAWTQITTGNSRSYTVKIPENAVRIKITAPEGVGTVAAIFDEYTYPPTDDATPDYCTEYPGRIAIGEGASVSIDITADMNYLYVGAVNMDGDDILPTVEVSAVKSEPGGSSGPQTIINNNTYNISTSPTITTDANGWLQPIDTQTAEESGVTDVTGAIMAMLETGYCHLAPGIFYVSGNIEMPDNSRLEGCGYGTIIKLMDGVDASTIIMGASCSVANLSVYGALTSGTVPETIGTRFGIEWSGSDKANGIISGCKIFKFSGAGILLKDTGTPVNKGLAIDNCYILYNTAGIFIQKDSEFNKIENCTIYRNRWGILNRGGNNIVCNCGVDKNVIGIQVDDDEGENNGHGSISNCTINHSNDNTGYGIIIEGTGRMLISNCNLYYSKIKLEGTNGNVFTGCGFGQNAGLDVINGECNILNGCMMRDSANFPISITNNNVTQIVNCFYRTGTQVVLP